jgi:hypothetical protein
VITFKCAGFRQVNNDEAPNGRLKFESPPGDIPQQRVTSHAAGRISRNGVGNHTRD